MDELNQLRSIRPEPPEPSRQTLLAGLDLLTEDSRTSANGLTLRLPRPSVRVLRTATVGGLGVSLAAGLFVTQTLTVGDGGTGDAGPQASAHAAMILNKAALAAENEPSIRHEGDFAYVEVVRWEPPGGEEHARVHPEGHRIRVTTWRSLDGSREGLRRARTTPPESKPGAGTNPRLDVDSIAPNRHPDMFDDFPTHEYLHALPRNPEAMLAKVRTECAKNWEMGKVVRDRCRPGDAFGLIGRILMTYVVPPDVRATLFEAAANIRGMTVVENVRLTGGQRGVAVRHTEDGHQLELVFDPETYELLGSRTIVTDPQFADSGLEPGDVLSSTTIVEKGLVDEIGQRP